MSEVLKKKDLDPICKKLDFILAEVKETKEKVILSSERIVRVETKVEAGEIDRVEIKKEILKIWDQFKITKDEIKADLKEYIGIVVKQEVSKLKNWVYASVISGIVALVTIGIKLYG